MTTETTEGVEVEQQVQTPEQAAQAFAAGFEDDEDTQTPTPAAEPTPPAAQAPEAPAKEEPQPPKLAQITEEQFSELMAKVSQFEDGKRQIDTLAGHIGGVKQVVESLKQQRKSLSAGQLKRVAAGFPELAEALQSDLSEMGGVDPVDIDKRVESIVESRVAAKAIEFETKLLRFYHRDWDQVVVSNDFLAWKNQLPEAERTKLDNSNDGQYIADKLTEFKAAKAAQDKAAADAAAKAKSSNSRQQRLEAAVPPRGTGAHAPSRSGVPSDFQAGWDSA